MDGGNGKKAIVYNTKKGKKWRGEEKDEGKTKEKEKEKNERIEYS